MSDMIFFFIQGIFLWPFLIGLVLQTLIVEIYGLKTLKLKERQIDLQQTTPVPEISQTSTELITSNPSTPSVVSNKGPPRGRKRKRRLRKVLVQKRQGEYLVNNNNDDEDGLNFPLRQPLYEEQLDEIHVPQHYYSPIRKQRMRRKKLFKNRGQQIIRPGLGNLEQPSNQFEYRKRERYPQQAYHPEENSEEFRPSTEPPPKNYAFAYAVRDDDDKKEDFSHKEARDGQLTMGEYRINLPDGRTQVVRYTAGGTIGYKADVTYEGEGDDHPRKKELTSKLAPVIQGNDGYLPPHLRDRERDPPSSSPRERERPKKKYRKRKKPVYQSYSSSSLSAPPYVRFPDDDKPTYSRVLPPLPTYKKPAQKSTRYYEEYPSSIGNIVPTEHLDIQKTKYGYTQKEDPSYSGSLSYSHEQSPRAGPGKRRKKTRRINEFTDGAYPGRIELEEEIKHLRQSYRPPKLNFKEYQKPRPLYNEPGPGNYYLSVNPTPTPSQKFPKYPKPVDYSPSTTRAPLHNSIVEDSPAVDLDIHIHRKRPYLEQSPLGNDYDRPPSTIGGYTPISFRTGQSKALIPIEEFKAGPSRSQSSNKKRPHSQNNVFEHSTIGSPPKSYNPEFFRYKEPFHYYNSQHPSYHHGGYVPPSPTPNTLHSPSSREKDPPSTSYTIDFPGGKHSFFLKNGGGGKSKKLLSNSPYSQQKEKKKASTIGSGLVYFETPGTGPRPNTQINSILSHFPNMPSHHQPTPTSTPKYLKTTIHPYEIGSKDYGKSVSYRNSFNTPSSGEHHSGSAEHGNRNENDDSPPLTRDYLVKLSKDKIVPDPLNSKRPTSTSHHVGNQFFIEKISSSTKNHPTPTPSPSYHRLRSVSTPQTFHDIPDYNLQGQQLSSTPTVFIQPAGHGINPSTVSPTLSGPPPQDYVYQYEDGVK